VKQSLVLEYADGASETSRSVSSFDLSSISSTVESKTSLILNVNDLKESKDRDSNSDSDSLTPRWSTRLDSFVNNGPAIACNFNSSLYSVLFSQGETIYHLNCTTFVLTSLSEGSGLILSSSSLQHQQPNVARDNKHTVLSYHIDGQNRQVPVLSLLLGNENEKPEKIIKIELIEKT